MHFLWAHCYKRGYCFKLKSKVKKIAFPNNKINGWNLPHAINDKNTIKRTFRLFSTYSMERLLFSLYFMSVSHGLNLNCIVFPPAPVTGDPIHLCISQADNGPCTTRWLATANTCLTTTTQFWKGLAVWRRLQKKPYLCTSPNKRWSPCLLPLNMGWPCDLFWSKESSGSILVGFLTKASRPLQLPLLFSCCPKITMARIASLLMRGHVYRIRPSCQPVPIVRYVNDTILGQQFSKCSQVTLGGPWGLTCGVHLRIKSIIYDNTLKTVPGQQ